MQITGTIFDLKKFAIHDGPGIRTTVFLKGCPMDCWWCHNPEGVKAEPETISVKGGSDTSSSLKKEETVGREATVEELMEEIEKDTIFYDQSGGGVTFSGGEPLMQEGFLYALLEACGDSRINTAIDTSGYAPWEIFDKLIGSADMFLYDLKIIDDTEHQRYTGVSNELILENLRLLAERNKRTIIRIPLIPGITDTETNLKAMVDFLTPLKNIYEIDFLPYNKIGEDKFRRFDISSRVGPLRTQTDEELANKTKQFKSRGYKVSVGG